MIDNFDRETTDSVEREPFEEEHTPKVKKITPADILEHLKYLGDMVSTLEQET